MYNIEYKIPTQQAAGYFFALCFARLTPGARDGIFGRAAINFPAEWLYYAMFIMSPL
jgi:hypothetical protein